MNVGQGQYFEAKVRSLYTYSKWAKFSENNIKIVTAKEATLKVENGLVCEKEEKY